MCHAGQHLGTYDTTEGLCAAMAAAVDQAEDFCHVEYYIAWQDDATDVFFASLVAAVERGSRCGCCWITWAPECTRAGRTCSAG